MIQLSFNAVHLLDSSCLVRLDGMDRVPPNPPDFTHQERLLIWDGLECLAQDGRLKLIAQVKKELMKWHPRGLERLVVYPGHRLVIQRTVSTMATYRTIIAAYPAFRPTLKAPDPADAWLIIAAKRRGFRIVTMELSLADRAPTAKKELRIPDAAVAEGLLKPLNVLD